MGDTPRPTARERARAKRRTNETVAEVVELMPADARERRRRAPRRAPEPGRAKVSKRSPSPKSVIPEGEDPRPRLSVQLGKRWSQVVQEVRAGEYTWEEFTEGLEPEELARGQLMDRNGRFTGKPPAMVPREFHLACQRELRRRFDEKIQGRLLDAVDEYIKLSKNTEDEKLKEQMLRYTMERVVGGIPKQVEIGTAPKHEGFLAGVIRKGGIVDRSGRYDRRTADIKDEDGE